MGAIKLEQGKYYSFEEYLKLENEATDKHEFHDGEIVYMPGGSLNHSLIASHITSLLDQAIDKNDLTCKVTTSDMKIFMESVNHSVYPDVMVFCDKPEFYKKSKSIIVNPELVVEVLSKSTRNYDLGLKFLQYRTLPSFKEYVVVWQTIPKILSWYKEAENLWRISSAFGLESSIKFHTVNATLKLKDIYKRIDDLGSKDDMKAF